MAEDMIEKAPPRRDWLSYLIRGAATLIAVVITMVTWGQQIESEINEEPRPTSSRQQIEKLRADLRNLDKDAAARAKESDDALDPGESPVAAGQGPIGHRAIR